MKLNVKRTIWIGLAFFGILLVWQLYNSYCSPMLSFLFVRSDLPEAVEKFNALNLVDSNGKALIATTTNLLKYGCISSDDFLDVQWKVGIIMALDNIAALFIMPIFGNLSDKTQSKFGKRMPYIMVGSVATAIALPFIPLFFNDGMSSAQADIIGCIVGMVTTMIVIIVFMMSYRSPAVALMPDFTPKPLRSKANGIINVVGYVGGAVGSVFAIVLPVTKFIDGTNRSLWMLEVPFIVCSVVLLVSLALLLIKVRENKLHAELDPELKKYEDDGEVVDNVSTSKMSKNNLKNLVLILVAEMLWFMSLNAIETFQTNYVMFQFNTSSAGGALMTVLSGAASVVGFLLAGKVADKIGRKWTIFIGICGVTVCYLIYSLIPSVDTSKGLDFTGKLPFLFFVILPMIGFSTSLIHICSFPLVTDYCTADKLGKFTSLYYTASMLAQSVTPILIGLIFRKTGWGALPIYSCVLIALAGVVFFFVKAPRKQDKAKNAKGLEALGSDD